MAKRTTAKPTPPSDTPLPASEPVSPPAEPGLLTPAQRATLLAAKAWWQEGEHSLDYMAERARLLSRVEKARIRLSDLRDSSEPSGAQIAPILPLLRSLSANRTLNRNRATDDFAQAVQTLLRSEAPLPVRLTDFLAAQKVGGQTVSQILYAADPGQFPLVSPATRSILAPTRAQRNRAQAAARDVYGETVNDLPRAVRTLLGDFALYEAARSLLGVESFTDLNAILWHAREMPATPPVKETSVTAAFATASNRSGEAAVPSPTVVRESTARYGREREFVAAEAEPRATETELLRYIEGFVAAQGFTFPPLAVRDYYVALKTKPFVILSGLSGTGKTRLTELMAEALTANVSGQYLLIAVRPDWTDSTALLGYHNLLTDKYVSTSFLDKLTIAAQPENRERAFFLCLDELNLARVEHYFADILSAMETRSHAIPLHGALGRTVTLPPNVFLTGSVNVDEATVPLSKKVLDRANVIEFNEVSLLTPTSTPVTRAALPDIPARERQRLFLNARVADVRAAQERLAARNPDYPDRVLGTLAALNDRLQTRNLHFGYRVRDEAMSYIANSFAADGSGDPLLIGNDAEANLQTALDLQIVQKALPRLSGTQEALENLLRDLTTWAETENLPRTAAKLARMRRRAAEDGFVSFYEG